MDIYDRTLRGIVDEHGQRKCQADQCFLSTMRTYSLQRDTESIVGGCGSGLVCVIIIKCSRLVKFWLKIPLPLLNQNIIIKRSKHSRQIEGPFFSLVNKVLNKGQTVLPNSINSYTDIAIVLITSSVKIYYIYIVSSFPSSYHRRHRVSHY